MTQKGKRWSFNLVTIWKVLREWRRQRKAWKELDRKLKAKEPKYKVELSFNADRLLRSLAEAKFTLLQMDRQIPMRPWGVMEEEWSDPDFRASYGKAPGV